MRSQVAGVGEGAATLSAAVLAVLLLKVAADLRAPRALKGAADHGAPKDAHGVLGVDVVGHLLVFSKVLAALGAAEGGGGGVDVKEVRGEALSGGWLGGVGGNSQIEMGKKRKKMVRITKF